MHKIKLLSWKTGVEIEAESLMIGPNSMTGHNQKVDLSLKRWENASIIGKKGNIKRNCWHWNKEQTEYKDEKDYNEKNIVADVLDEDVLMLSLEEQKCEYVAKMMLSGLLI